MKFKFNLSIITIIVALSSISLAGEPVCEKNALEVASKLWSSEHSELSAEFEKENSNRESDGLESWFISVKNSDENFTTGIRIVFEKAGKCYFRGAATVLSKQEADKDVMSLLFGK